MSYNFYPDVLQKLQEMNLEQISLKESLLKFS